MRTRHEHPDRGFSAQLCIDITSSISTYLSGAPPLTDAHFRTLPVVRARNRTLSAFQSAS